MVIYLTYHIVTINIINGKNIVQICGGSVKCINNISLLILRKRHNKIPLITKQE